MSGFAQQINPEELPLENQRELKNSNIGVVIGQVIQIIFGAVFIYFASDPKLYNGDDCGDLQRTCKVYGYIMVITGGITLLGQCIFINQDQLKNTLNCCLTTISGILSLIYFIKMILAINNNHPCGQLATVSLAYIWMTGAIIMLICCVGCIAAAWEQRRQSQSQ